MAKNKNSEEQALVSPSPPKPAILEAKKLLCASLASSKCTVFLENYGRKFASQRGDAPTHVHPCSGTCDFVSSEVQMFKKGLWVV